MLRRILLSLTAGLFIFTNITPAHAFHNGNSGALTAQADSQSGSANFAVPIDVPPGRAGIQPNIQLQYSSSLPNGLLGTGWSLELGSIQRSTKKGVPSYTDSDTFVLLQSGSSQELVFDAAAGFYRAKTEGAFMKTEFINNSYWRVTDKKGTRYYFGEDQAAREYDPANTARVFKWALNRVEDLNGNTMTIAYWRDGNRLYPQYIDYTSNPSNGLAGFARVEFVWAPRADVLTGYTMGFNVRMNYRLDRIDARAGTDLQYRFVLNYHQSNATGRSVLEKITQYGADGTSTLPPLTFQYQELASTYGTAVVVLGGSIMGDFNGDGRTDRASYSDTADTIGVVLSSGISFVNHGVWFSGSLDGLKLFSGNFDTDGIADICAFNAANGEWRVYTSNGTDQFTSKGTWLTGFGAGKDPGLGDFNGDGLTDVLYFYDAPDGSFRAAIALNTGTNFTAIVGATPVISTSNAKGITGDFNGDGLTDLGLWYAGNGFWEIKLNTGDITAPFAPMVTLAGFGAGKPPLIADFNSDGLTDIGYYDTTGYNAVYRLSNGSGFGSDRSLFLGWGNPEELQAVDFNGDGLPDFVSTTEVVYANGTFPDLLARSDNGVGGTTTIEYAPSTTFNNPQLPFPLHLVRSAGQSNNLGDVYTTQYEYAGGLWDGAAREFHGFGSVKVIDPDANYMETQFRQDSPFHGRPLEQRAYDSGGQLFSKTVNLWNSQQITPGVNFVYLRQQDNYVYNGDATGRRTAQEFFYEETPQMGTLTKAVQLGEVDLATGNDIGADKRSVETTYYAPNTSNWLIGLPRQTLVKDNAGNIVRQSWFFYDNQANTATPVKGLLTKKEDWAGAGNVNPLTQYSYDAIGNLATTTDPKENITRVTYDPAYKMFPLETENALTHKVVNEYYGVNGVALSGGGFNGLWGQVKSTTDPNQQQGKRSYDVFGRLTTTISPLDSLAYPTQTTAIEYFSDHTKVTGRRRTRSGQAQTIDTVSFYDGLGRLVQTKTPTETAGQYAVSGQAEYDARGLKTKQYLPYFSTGLLDTVVPIDPSRPRSTIEYDAMGRPVRTTNADGTYASAAYDDWTTTATNENGHRQRSYFDAYGRLIKKEEYTGADGRSSHYLASPYTLYATTLYSYDSEGNLLQTKDAYNNITTITYDVLGRKTAMTDPDMGQWSYEYDLNGNLTKQIDAKGQTLSFTYDALNRLTNKTDGVGGTVNVNYTYDNATVANSKGRLTQAAYTGGNTQFAYDELGRELQSIKAMNTTNYSVNRGYDALNNLLQVQYPDQKNIYYKYNGAGQIEAISNDATILPQSLNLRNGEQETLLAVRWRDSNRSSSDVARSINDQRMPFPAATPDDEIRTTRTFLSSVGEWFERNVLGVSDAYAQAALPDSFKQESSSNGLVSIETENYHVNIPSTGGTPKWDRISTTGQSGIGSMKANPNSGVIKDTGNTANSPRLDYKVKFVKTGTHYIWIRAIGATTNDDSLHAGLDGQALTTSDKITNFTTAWTWSKTTADASAVATINVATTGEHTLNLWMREDGVVIDKIVVTTSASYIPSGTGPAESPQVVPAAPVLNAPVVGNAQVSLSWSAVSGASGYKVYRGLISKNYGAAGTDTGSARTYTSTGLTNGTVYYFAVVAYNAAGQSVYSNEVSATPVAPPPAPVLNTAVAGDKQVTLTWAAATDATGYKIYYGTATGVYGTPITIGNVTSATVTGLTNGTKYYFAVSATNAGGESGKSNEVNATPALPSESATLFVKNVDYNAAGQMTKVEYGNGDVTEYTYDPLTLRLTRLKTYDLQLTTIQDLNYTYDSVGNILSITDNVNTADQAFQYDALNRLKQATGNYANNGTTQVTKTYVYDAIGNIVEKDGKTYSYGVGSGGPHAVTSTCAGATCTNYTYDLNGNMVTKVEGGVTTAYTYDAENRLIKVVKNGSTIGQYEYDGDGGRTKKTATVAGTTTTTTSIGSLFETSGARTTKFIFLGDQRIAAVTNSPSIGSTTLYYHADHLGGANVLTDATGFKKELIEYEPFGLESRHEKYGSNEEVAWYYFTGKKTDDESGLIYFGARYYDPSLGRFITADSVIQNPYDPQTLNRYSYCGNNPTSRIDPDGHKWSWKKFWKAAVGAFVGAVVTVLTGGLGAPIAFALGGTVGGAITGGLEGGWQGALLGGLTGGILGGGIGLGIGAFGPAFGVGALVAGAGVAGATNNWDSFAGGLVGGFLGAQVGNGIQSYYQDGISVQLPEGQTNPFDNKNWDMLGIGTTDAKAAAFANKNGSAAFYTRSRGLLADFVRAGMQKVAGNSLASRQFSGYLRGANGFYISAHSEGTLTLAGAIKTLSVDGVKLPQLKMDFNGPVIMKSTAYNLANMIGAPQPGYHLNPGDPIGVFATPNPVMIGIYGAVGIPTLATFHQTDYYPHMNAGN